MKEFPKQLRKEKENIRMSARERENVRGYLLDYLEHKPLRAAPPREAVPSTWFVFHTRFSVTALVVVLMFSLGGGVAFASERALPGDVLYPIKVAVNEEVRAAFAVTSEADFEWSVRRAERRLEEAEQLAAEGRLSREWSDELEERFEEHTDEALAAGESIEIEDEGLSIALNVGMEATLLAHQEILDRLALLGEADDREHAGRLLARVSEQIERVDSARSVIARADAIALAQVQTERRMEPDQAEGTANETTDTSTMTFMAASEDEAAPSKPILSEGEAKPMFSTDKLDSLRDAASRRIEVLGNTLDTSKIEANESAHISLERALALAEERLATGDRYVSDENYRDALLMYRDVLQITTRALLFARIGAELHILFDENNAKEILPADSIEPVDQKLPMREKEEENPVPRDEDTIRDEGRTADEAVSATSTPENGSTTPIIEVDVDKDIIDRIY